MGIELRREPTKEEVEQICSAAEEAARGYVLSSISIRRVSDLDVTIEAVGGKPLLLNIEVAIELASGTQDLRAIVDEATNRAFSAAEAKVRELNLCVDTPA